VSTHSTPDLPSIEWLLVFVEHPSRASLRRQRISSGNSRISGGPFHTVANGSLREMRGRGERVRAGSSEGFCTEAGTAARTAAGPGVAHSRTGVPLAQSSSGLSYLRACGRLDHGGPRRF